MLFSRRPMTKMLEHGRYLIVSLMRDIARLQHFQRMADAVDISGCRALQRADKVFPTPQCSLHNLVGTIRYDIHDTSGVRQTARGKRPANNNFTVKEYSDICIITAFHPHVDDLLTMLGPYQIISEPESHAKIMGKPPHVFTCEKQTDVWLRV